MRRRTLFPLALAALLALNAVLLVVQPGLAFPQSLTSYLLGPKMVKAEIVVKDRSVTHDYRIDQGKIRAVGTASITLYERTGDLVTIPVAAGAKITLGGRTVSLAALKRGMRAQTLREGTGPAVTIQAFKR
jgi:CO/xanthine dehydrogenase FAD-binding subunit